MAACSPAEEVVSTTPAGGQAFTIGRGSTLTISPIWRVGESYDLEITKEEGDVLNGEETLILTGRTQVEVTILDQLDGGGYVLQWS